MIIRVLTGRLRAERAGELGPVAREKLPALREHPGLVAAHLGRQAEHGEERFVFVTVWRTASDLYAWAGADLSHPAFLKGHEAILAAHSVQHYETLDDEIPEWPELLAS